MANLSAERQGHVLDDGRVGLVWVELFFLSLELSRGRGLHGGGCFCRLVVVRVDDHDGIAGGPVDLGRLGWLRGLGRRGFDVSAAPPENADAGLVAIEDNGRAIGSFDGVDGRGEDAMLQLVPA